MTFEEACVAINMVPGIGPIRLRKLLNVFGEPQAVLGTSASKLDAVAGLGAEISRRLATWEEHVDLRGEYDRMRESGVEVITSQSAVYPDLLKAIHDPPIVLYCWGRLEVRDATCIGMVGSRQTSYYGLETAKKLSYQLSSAGLTIVSGLARGIDTACHQGALAAKGRTVAVLGCGLSEIYPAENYGLAERIADGSGAVISEFPMLVKPDRRTFPMRNRIISGFGMGLLVVEAGLNSGALISANQALEQGRTVFAVPGPINTSTSQGTNRLIQQGAKLVMDAADVIEEMSQLLPGISVSEPTPDNSLPGGAAELKTGSSPGPDTPGKSPLLSATSLKPEEIAVYAAVEISPTPIDRIISTCGLPTSAVSSTLFALELKKLVKQLPGKHFVKVT